MIEQKVLQDGSPNDVLPLSEGFETFPVWIKTADEPVRDSKIDNIYVFKDSKVTMYNLDGSNTDRGSVAIEDILGMSDDELVKFASETSNKIYQDKEKKIKEQELFDVESFNEFQEDFQLIMEDIYGDDDDYSEIFESYFKDQKLMTENSYYNVEGEIPEQSSRNYTLDINIDDLGQNTEEIDFIIPKATSNLARSINSNSFTDYINFLYSEDDKIFLKSENETSYNDIKDSYIEKLKQEGSFVEKNVLRLTTHKTLYQIHMFGK